MNKQELIKQAEKLQVELDILKEKIEKCDDECVRWRAEQNMVYYYVPDSGMPKGFNNVTCRQECNSWIDGYRYARGNYFKTEQEAIDYSENILVKQKLKDLALRLNNKVEIDFRNKGQTKYYIFFDFINNVLYRGMVSVSADIGSIYCLNEDFLKIAEREIGEEALIKLIKSGV